jgi:hypothetical protein
LIRLLVPIALTNPTALDAVLSRLVLADRAAATDAVLLRSIEANALARAAPPEPDIVVAAFPS